MCVTTKKKRQSPPARTVTSRENQLIALSVDLAEEQLKAGTASSQVITHFLKLGTRREELERDKLKSENELLKAKVVAIQSQAKAEELYREAIKAVRRYNGDIDDDQD
jgi:hypothetical protein